MIAIVDDEDYEYLNQFKWREVKRNSIYYAQRECSVNGKHTCILMHREILGFPKGKRTDHKDMNGLNNQRSNLRTCSASQNAANTNPLGGSSKFKGVSCRLGKSWNSTEYYPQYRARITVNKKEIWGGTFRNEIDAAKAYNELALKYFGEFAKLNNI